MPANDTQIGGNHYKQRGDVQHWDTMTIEGVPYVIGCATKYVSRWHSKNGVQDLEKAIHYLEKYKENVHIVNTYWRMYFKSTPIESILSWTDGRDEAIVCSMLLNLGGRSDDEAYKDATRAQKAIRNIIEDFVPQPTAEQLHPR